MPRHLLTQFAGCRSEERAAAQRRRHPLLDKRADSGTMPVRVSPDALLRLPGPPDDSAPVEREVAAGPFPSARPWRASTAGLDSAV